MTDKSSPTKTAVAYLRVSTKEQAQKGAQAWKLPANQFVREVRAAVARPIEAGESV